MHLLLEIRLNYFLGAYKQRNDLSLQVKIFAKSVFDHQIRTKTIDVRNGIEIDVICKNLCDRFLCMIERFRLRWTHNNTEFSEKKNKLEGC